MSAGGSSSADAPPVVPNPAGVARAAVAAAGAGASTRASQAGDSAVTGPDAPLRLYISTGEISGEEHAARLVSALRELHPGATFTGMGGEILRGAGVKTFIDSSSLRVMGFVEVLRHLPTIRRALRKALDHIEREKPDGVVLVDYPGFHLRLARELKRRYPTLPVLQYIAPKCWAWNERRVKKLRALDGVLGIFPFEEDWFRARGVAARYVGNPTMDAVREVPARPAAREALDLPREARLVSLFPGSRRSELQRILPTLLATMRRLQDNAPPGPPLAFALALAPGVTKDDLAPIAALPAELIAVAGRSRELMAASDLVLAKSGTTTLEAALLGVPMIVLYRTHPLTAFIALKILRLGAVSLPNIIADREIVPELLQDAARPDRLADLASELLQPGERRERMRADLLELRERLGDTPAAQRTAEAVLQLVRPGR